MADSFDLSSAFIPKPTRCSRVWNQRMSGLLFQATQDYCSTHSKVIETLAIDDFKVIGKDFHQSPFECFKKVKEILMCGTTKAGVWCSAEDELLTSCVRDGLHWKEIANRLNCIIYSGVKVRCSKHCRERWNNHLNPVINRGPWTTQDDLAVMEGFKRHRTAWNRTASELGNRTGTAVKNRFKSLMNKERQLYGEGDVDSHVDRIVMRLRTQYCDFEFSVNY